MYVVSRSIIFPYSVQKRENVDQKNSEYVYFSCRYLTENITKTIDLTVMFEWYDMISKDNAWSVNFVHCMLLIRLVIVIV